MTDVTRMPDNSFGTVPTPAIVAPIEFTMRLADYQALGGHMEYVRSLSSVLQSGAWHNEGAPQQWKWLQQPDVNAWPSAVGPMLG
jgi:6-hydroxynicotinate reductase